MSDNRLSIAHLKGGAIIEMGDHMLMELIENVMDPNTKADAVRKLTLELVVKPGKDRAVGSFEIRTKSTLAPQAAVEGTLSFGHDSDGCSSASEIGGEIDPNRVLLPGTVTDNKSAAAGDSNDEETIEPTNHKVTPMQRAGGM
ncbi:hypothetical protein D0S45_17540 [Marinifilum sp. JC120]|nr:hypothetical protein D0S45_17540 [Marinifilum sp. JC120]